MPKYPGTSVILDVSPVREKGERHIEISVSQYSSSAKTSMDERIAEYKRGSRIGFSRDFVVREKVRVIVAGAQGWEITISYTVLPFTSVDGGSIDAPTPAIGCDLFFDYQGMVWQVFLYTDPESYNNAKADFDHILQTFKILD